MTRILRSRAVLQDRIAQTFMDPQAIYAVLNDPKLPDALSKWLARLRLLKGVPFPYLVPDEEMLPPESIRFFYLDMNWVDALIDGAFSIGRNVTTTADAASMNLDAAVKPAVHPQIAEQVRGIRSSGLGLPAPQVSLQIVSGFLLRSSVVSAYRGIGVNVYPVDGTPQSKTGIKLLDILRFEPLGPASDTLICLVDGDAYQVDVHEAPEHLHYGINEYQYDPQTGKVSASKMIHTFQKEGAAVTMSETETTLPLDDCFRASSPRVLKMSSLAAAIGKQSGYPSVDSAEMGFEMTEGVGMVSFIKGA